MIKHIVPESVGSNGVIDIVILISIPVICQFLGAKHKNGLVSVFVVFDNGKCGKGFTKTDAIRKDTAVVFFEFIDDGKGSVLLEIVEHPPNLTFLEAGRFVGQNIFGHIFQKLIEDVIERHEVDEIGRVLVVCGGDTVNYLIGNDLKHFAVIPYLIEVGKQSAGKGLIFHDCGADYIAFFAAQFNRSEVIDRRIAYTVNYDLSLNGFVADIRLESDLLPDPLCTLSCNGFLGQLIPELDFKLCSVKASFTGQARDVELTPFLFCLFGHEGRRSENKAKFFDL